MRSGRLLLSLLGLLLCVGHACADDWSLPQLMASLAAVQHSRAHFSEEKHLAMLTEPLRQSGTLAYERPDRIEKIVTRPKPESLVVIGDQLDWHNAAGHRRVSLTSQPQLWALVASLRATLAGDLPTLERYYRIKLAGSAPQWQLTLTPRYPSLAQTLDEIRIDGSVQQVREVTIVEADGDRSVMHIDPE
jgi:outer membrane lipoprotein-sorting protein